MIKKSNNPILYIICTVKFTTKTEFNSKNSRNYVNIYY